MPPHDLLALVLDDKSRVRPTKLALEAAGLLDKSARIASAGPAGPFLLPLRPDILPADRSTLAALLDPAPVVLQPRDPPAPAASAARAAPLKAYIPHLLRSLADDPAARPYVGPILAAGPPYPSRYQVYPPLLLFSPDSFGPAWTPLLTDPAAAAPRARFFAALLRHAAATPHAPLSHVAENAPIAVKSDVLRRPAHIRALYHAPAAPAAFDDLWVSTTQNGILQTWAPAHTMFSRGNIREKTRVLALASRTAADHPAPVAVDLYAGIGYFTFSYARAGFAAVFCWDLNPWSTRALLRGAALNAFPAAQFGASDACDRPDAPGVSPALSAADYPALRDFVRSNARAIAVFNEDNLRAPRRLRALAASTPLHIAHINLGTLPSTALAWPAAIEICAISACSSIALHIHANVPTDQIDPWTTQTRAHLQALDPSLTVTFSHLERIKTYAPGIWHVCGDYLVTKNPVP